MTQKANLWFAFCFFIIRCTVNINTANASASLLHCFASLTHHTISSRYLITLFLFIISAHDLDSLPASLPLIYQQLG
ncbi:hypothetical protein FW758_06630 [Shewanella sp. 1180_01]